MRLCARSLIRNLQQFTLSPRAVLPFPTRKLSHQLLLTTSATMQFPKPSNDPPKHEMAYFPDMTTSLPSQSGDFRRVLWTGLYSQLVLMTVPVGGDIGDEVCIPTLSFRLVQKLIVAETHCRSDSHLHIRNRSCNYCRQGSRC